MKERTTIRTIVRVVALVAIAIVVVSVLRASRNNRLYKLLDEGRTEEALALIERMDERDVNAYSAPLFLLKPMGIFTQGMWRIELPLVYACEKDNLEVVEALLKKGADPNRFVELHWTPLEAAFVNKRDNRLEIAKLLIEYGADVNLHASSVPPLFLLTGTLLYKVEDGKVNVEYLETSIEVIFLLLDNGANPIHENYGSSVLHNSAYGNHVAVSARLIDDYHLPIDTIDDYGQTPLMYSARNNSADTARLLLEHGADRSIADNDGKTAYDFAVENGNIELMELLKP